MSHYKETHFFKNIFKKFYISFIPNNRDNFKQITIKLTFLISFIVLIVSIINISAYFLTANKEKVIIDQSRELWHQASDEEQNNSGLETQAVPPSITNVLLQQNSDFKGWITINGTNIDNPIYQTNNNDFYLNHNQNKKQSAYGALFFDCDDKITPQNSDKNLVIYGHDMKNGTMFGSLEKLRSLNFYKTHPTIEFSTLHSKDTYKIFSIFVLNAVKADDNGYIFDIYRDDFSEGEDFDKWKKEAYQRSIIDTKVDLNSEDNIITLVTCSDDFENARLVVMARKIREGEDDKVDTTQSTLKAYPRYPKRWYDEREIIYPY